MALVSGLYCVIVCINWMQTMYIYCNAQCSHMNSIVSEDEMCVLATVCSSLVTLLCSSSAVQLFGHPLKVHVFEVISTPILAISIPGAHQVGETGTGVMLPFPWIGHLKVEKWGRIMWQFKSFINWQVELQVLKSCSLKVFIQRWMWCLQN